MLVRGLQNPATAAAGSAPQCCRVLDVFAPSRLRHHRAWTDLKPRGRAGEERHSFSGYAFKKIDAEEIVHLHRLSRKQRRKNYLSVFTAGQIDAEKKPLAILSNHVARLRAEAAARMDLRGP